VEESRRSGGEVVALDDGSTDGSLQVMRRFAPTVRVASGPNRGASAARNALAQMARAEWLLFLDADDLLAEGTVERRIARARASAAEAVYCDWRGFHERPGDMATAREEARALERLAPHPAIALFGRYWAPPGAWMVRMDLHRRVGGFRVDLPVIQDARFAVDIALAGARIVHCAGIGLHYREGDQQSLSRRDARAFTLDCLRNAEQLEPEFARHGLLDAARPALAETYEFCARSLVRSSPDAAARALRAALRLSPSPSRWLRAGRFLSALAGERLGVALLGRIEDAWGAR
jgi:glycosyltransferase involved in cell wall biosynthesis